MDNERYKIKDAFLKRIINQKLTQQQIAEGSGVTIGTVRRMLHGNDVLPATAEKISVFFNKKLDSIFSLSSEPKALPEKTIRDYHHCISSILSSAVDDGLISANPALGIKFSKIEHEEKAIIPSDEAKADLIRKSKDLPLIQQLTFFVAISTGLRLEELAAIMWSDIDFDHQTLAVTKAITSLKHKGEFVKTTKRPSSIRTIKLPAETIKLLRQHHDDQLAAAATVGIAPPDYVFFNFGEGKRYTLGSISKWVSKFLHTNGFPELHLHSLRHTFASFLYALDVPVTSISSRLGHATPQVTNTIYAHDYATRRAIDDEIADKIFGSSAEDNSDK